MKSSVLALIVATAAFGGSSIYLWNQLQSERARSDEYAAKSASLNARIAELEKAREQFGQRRFASASSFGGSPMGGPEHGGPPPGAAAGKPEDGEKTGWGMGPPPLRSPAMQKMMRAQMRATNRFMYADIGAELGLSKDLANKLIDLLTDQQTAGIEPMIDAKTPEESQRLYEETRRKNETEISDLIGADKAEELAKFQKSMPARQEVDMLARQFEGNDAPLTDDQRKRLLTTIMDERDRIPQPQFTENTDPEEYRKSQLAWESDYAERVSSDVRGFLSTPQLNAYTEYTQAQKEMREQMGAMMATMPRRMSGAPRMNVTFTSAAPAGVALAVGSTATVVVADPKSGSH